ncbi:MAG: hypothetical protein N2444_09460 [Methylocystis sp.]|nr:hypothetical protein [Methylocystis sp.]
MIDLIRAAKDEGRPVFPATAADGRRAKIVADHIGLFDGVMASDGEWNLPGESRSVQRHYRGRKFAPRTCNRREAADGLAAPRRSLRAASIAIVTLGVALSSTSQILLKYGMVCAADAGCAQ